MPGSPSTTFGNKRRCGRCHKLLPLTRFTTWKDYRGDAPRLRYYSYCRKCRTEWMKHRYYNDPEFREKYLARCRMYNQRRKQKQKEQQ